MNETNEKLVRTLVRKLFSGANKKEILKELENFPEEKKNMIRSKFLDAVEYEIAYKRYKNNAPKETPKNSYNEEKREIKKVESMPRGKKVGKYVIINQTIQ